MSSVSGTGASIVGKVGGVKGGGMLGKLINWTSAASSKTPKSAALVFFF